MPRVKKNSQPKPRTPKKLATSATKSVDDSQQLHESFIGNLTQLNHYWQKQSTHASKQLDAQKLKLKKAQDKLKDLKAKKVEKTKVNPKSSGGKPNKQLEKIIAHVQAQQAQVDELKAVVVQLRESAQHAKLNIKKYKSLQMTIEQAEKAFAQELQPSTEVKNTARPKAQAKASPKATAKKNATQTSKTKAVSPEKAKRKVKSRKKDAAESRLESNPDFAKVKQNEPSDRFVEIDTELQEAMNAALDLEHVTA